MSNRHKKQTASTRKPLVPIAMFLLLIGGGVVSGVITHRWSPSYDLQRATAALEKFPHQIGDWTGVDEELDERTMRVAAATGAIQRKYFKRESDGIERESDLWIQVTILCGPHGPISLHSPTVCFEGAGWELERDPEAADVAFGQDSTCQFWQADFSRRENLLEQKIVTNWGWNNGSGWSASEDPRFEYAGSPYLFKLYITSPARLASDEHKKIRDEFFQQVLQEFDRTVLKALDTTTSRNEQE